MSYTPITVTATGSPQTINIPWPFLDRAHVVVRANGVPLVSGVDFTWLTSSSLQITRTAGQTISVTRSSSLNTRLTDYVDGAPLPERVLDVDGNQPMFLLQEIEQETVQLEQQVINILTGVTPVPGATGQKYTFDAVAPTSPPPVPGDEWLDSTSGILYKFVNDGLTSAWVELGPQKKLGT